MEQKTIIANRNLLLSACFLFTVVIILSLNFPHRYSLGDLLLQKLHIPTQFAGGFFTMGMILLLLLITAFICLFHSLTKWRIRIIVLTILLISLLPPSIITAYQTLFGKGIYAVQYDEAESSCAYEMVHTNEATLSGTCYLPFTNVSDELVTFEVHFQETYTDDVPMVSLMNVEAPYTVRLQPYETKEVMIHTLIDVTELDEYVVSGEAYSIQIEIQANGKSREL
ncbi:MAG TPA: hypothetical protein VK029_02990 [Pseudogracilibacillus sp.]|nr:hypothetical protein [Pseudogracilibacillus sp.]